MALRFRNIKPIRSEAETSYVKHTPAGEMPDPSAIGEMTRRLQADLPVISNEWRQPVLFLTLLALVLTYGTFRLWKS